MLRNVGLHTHTGLLVVTAAAAANAVVVYRPDCIKLTGHQFSLVQNRYQYFLLNNRFLHCSQLDLRLQSFECMLSEVSQNLAEEEELHGALVSAGTR